MTTETVLKREDHTLSSGDMQPMAPLVPSHLDGKRLVLVSTRPRIMGIVAWSPSRDRDHQTDLKPAYLSLARKS